MFIVGVAFSIISFIVSLFTGQIMAAMLSLGIVVAFVYGRIKENKSLFTIAGIMIILTLFVFIKGQISVFSFYRRQGNVGAFVFTSIIYVIAFIVSAIVSRIIFKKYNTHIDNKNTHIGARNSEIDIQNRNIAQHNQYIDQQRKNLSAEIQQINKDMVAETGSWYPPDYYSIHAIDEFISYVKNHRADTVKEMINLYIESGYRNAVLQNQQEANAKLEQSLYNQQQMIQLQKVSNVLMMANCVANFATAANTSQIANNTSTIANNTSNMANDIDLMARKSGSKSWWQ